MLVLTRKITERIVIDGPCVIEIVKVQGNRVSMGFVADKNVSIKREELLNVAVQRDPSALEGINDHAKDANQADTL